MNKKIGVITLHRNVNFGANLQAYASSEYLNKHGFNACVVDYMPKEQNRVNNLYGWLKESYKNGKTSSIFHNAKLILALILSAGWKSKRLNKFSSFRNKYMKLTKYCKDEKDVASLGLYALVCGSDQIWNPDITEGIEPLFFGEVSGVPLRISYAASIGKEKLEEKDEEQFYNLVKKLDACSVREEQSKEYVQALTNKQVECVCDPVFLLDKQDYYNIITKSIANKKYVLVYSVVSNDEMTKIAKEYAKRKGLKLIEIGSGKSRSAEYKQVAGIGPLEFLNYFYYAETIFTNSFHGTAFSIIFEKDFYSVDNKSRGSRITNLLKKAGLIDRMIEHLPTENIKAIDYNQVKDNMKEYIQNSKEFLNNALTITKNKVIEENCIGCGACANICPTNAINLSLNKEGFLRAVINKGKCTDCGLCKQVCPSLISRKQTDFEQEVYAFKANDDIRKTSTSGGAFSAVANLIIDSGGSVYATGELQETDLRHKRLISKEQVERSRGVKYIQSDFSGCFERVREDLINDKIVLVSGTPCQISAMKNYVKLKNLPAEKLYLVDIICHGIPSPTVFKQYILWLESKYKAPVKKFHFRNKEISWRGNSTRVVLTDGRVLDNTREVNCFMNTYYSGNITNQGCYNCAYTTKERVSDLTISDYWGIESVDATFEDKLGVSMVLVNSSKGKSLFEQCEGQKINGSLDRAKQPQIKQSCARPKDREKFWEDYFEKDIEKLFKSYAGLKKPSIKSRIKAFIKKF